MANEINSVQKQKQNKSMLSGSQPPATSNQLRAPSQFLAYRLPNILKHLRVLRAQPPIHAQPKLSRQFRVSERARHASRVGVHECA